MPSSPSEARFAITPRRSLYVLGLCLWLPALTWGSTLLFSPRFSVAFDPAPEDAQVAILSGLEIPMADITLGAYAEFEFRVFGKDRIIPVTPTLRLQLQEVRYTLGTGLYLAMPLNRDPLSHAIAGKSHLRTEARLGGGVGYSLGEYRGTNLEPESLWVPWMDLGYGLRFGVRGSLTLGYQYRALPQTSPHRIALTLAVLVPL